MHPRAAAQCKFDAHRHRVSGGELARSAAGWSPTKHIWLQPLALRPFIDIAVGHADHPPASPAISTADDPLLPQQCFGRIICSFSRRSSPASAVVSVSRNRNRRSAQLQTRIAASKIASMDDYGTESDSDYTSYWRDWVCRVFYLAIHPPIYP
jgi:hypothetical protein